MQQLLMQAHAKLDTLIQGQTGRKEKLEALERGMQKLERDLETHAKAWLDSTQENFDELTQQIAGVSAEALRIRASLSDFKSTLLEVKRDVKKTATKEDIRNMATKDDIASMATKEDLGQINTALAEILDRLPPKS